MAEETNDNSSPLIKLESPVINPGVLKYPSNLNSITTNCVQFTIYETVSSGEGAGYIPAKTLNADQFVIGGTISGVLAGLQIGANLGDNVKTDNPATSVLSSIIGRVGGAIAGAAVGSLIAEGINVATNLQISPTQKQISSTIMLYMPDTVNESYNLSYEEDNLTDYKFPRYGAIGKNAFESLDNFGSSASNKNLTVSALAALKEIPQASGIPTDLLLKGQGVAINPQVQLLFKAVSLREFQMDFLFSPKNQTESDNVQKIIQNFKYYSAPNLTGVQTTSDSNSGFFFTMPATFGINFINPTNDTYNKYLHKFKNCVLQNINVDYAPNGFSTFTNGAPTQIRMTLQFKETEIVTKSDISGGY